MARDRTGWVRVRYGIHYVGFTLRSGNTWERAARDEAGRPLDATQARALIAALVADYVAGRWDPEAPALEPSPVPVVERVPTVAEYAQAWGAMQRYESAPEDRATVTRYIARAAIGSMAVNEVRPRHARTFIQWLVAHPSERGGTLAPRTIRNAFDVLRRVLRSAVVDELLESNPCEPVRGELPEIEDKDPTARAKWDFTRDEIEALIFDERLYLDRRIVHALRLLTGARIGEICALRWSDWDRTAKPLTKLTVSRAIKSVSRAEGSTKTRAIKTVPVHPVLEQVLRAWFETGWAETFGRAPAERDLIAPTVRGPRKGEPRTTHAENEAFQDDQRALGFTLVRHQHVARHAFVSRTLSDGGDGAVLRWITHAPPRTAHDGYTRADWGRLCAEIAKLNLSAPVRTDLNLVDVCPRGDVVADTWVLRAWIRELDDSELG
ncbi:MAG: tyrosine-type recombinase/integrase [Polyangiales bacterium]